MPRSERLWTVVGGLLFLGGVAFGTAFVGRGIADPVAELVFGPLPLYLELPAILLGFLVALVGLGVGSAWGDLDRYRSDGG
ncbi:MAG: hypothetical protein ABEJ61_07795 [Haloferacaceae archaeon]